MRTFDLAQNDSAFVADELARSDIQNESVLESMLHANPQAILDEPVFIFGRQPAVDTGILDLLALDQYGNLLIIELKVGQSGSGSASEETILSQPQNYAQSLESYTYDRLESSIKSTEKTPRVDGGPLATRLCQLTTSNQHSRLSSGSLWSPTSSILTSR